MKVALTFDDGPSKWTKPLLAVLEREGAKATFFVCGAAIDRREHILRRIHRKGHEIGNHTMQHPNLAKSSKRDVLQELADCSFLIRDIVGEAPRLYRAPYLNDSLVAQAVGEALGMVSVGADVIGRDWEDSSETSICRRIAGDTFDRAIILLHDGRPPHQPSHVDGGSLDDRAHTVRAAGVLIPFLKSRGYEFVTVSELLLETPALVSLGDSSD